jgi:hypothetical protein
MQIFLNVIGRAVARSNPEQGHGLLCYARNEAYPFLVIARCVATKQSGGLANVSLDCFVPRNDVYLFRHCEPEG